MNPVKAKANYSRICQLLVDKGGDALRAALHLIHPPSTLSAVLNANKSVLKKIRYSVINASQWNLLFPASGSPDSKNFDVTLLTILLRNICGLHPPATGWNVMPPTSDTSISANITRIKIFRNEVYGHRASAELDDTAFETLWQEISTPLVKLGIPQQDIDELKEAPLSPEEESYVQKLKEWKELEDELLSKLNDLENAVFELRRIVEPAVPSLVDQLARFEFTGKIDGLCKKFQDGTRRWFFEKLSNWLNDEESRVMILTAGPGVGKSVLSAKICDRYKQSSQLAAYHFCDFKNPDSRNPNRILQSLASQMCENVEGFRDKLTTVLRREHSRDSLSDAFRVLLHDALHALNGHEPMLIVVDALDESKTDDKSEFLELISDEFPELPAWVKIFISSRPELQVRNELKRLNPLEILPDDHDHNLDLRNYFLHYLPSLNERDLSSLVRKCEGSFLYAYYLVSELKEMDLGIEPNLKDYVPEGISGFYKKQFTRLKTNLQHFKLDTWSSILKCFVNVVAASREPLPVSILFTCMGLSGEDFDIRETIVGIMSEILPVYEGCLTVYHKSLWDWLTLDGYNEHAFVGNAAEGAKQLVHVCNNIYSDIAGLPSVSEFKVSPEKRYALKTGGKFLLEVGSAKDFHWLVNVRLNFLKLKYCGSLGVDISCILDLYRTKRPECHYWRNIHLCHFFDIMNDRKFRDVLLFSKSRSMYYIYLQSLANGYFHNVQTTIYCKNEAREILNKSKELWIEEVENRNTYDCHLEVISHVVLRNDQVFNFNSAVALSPNNKLFAFGSGRTVEVFSVPSLNMIFKLKVSDLTSEPTGLLFSPDSSFLLWNSVRSCVSIKDQKEVLLIACGPERVDFCCFSSCGTKLVSSEKSLLKVWDVVKKTVLVQVKAELLVEYCMFSDCNSCVLAGPLSQMKEFDFNDIAVFDVKTLEKIEAERIRCADPCLIYERNYQIISPSYWDVLSFNNKFEIRHFHLPSGGVFLIANRYCSKPFTWRDRKCVIYWVSHFSQLGIVYDFINQEFVDLFHINCLPKDTSVSCISKVNEMNLFLCLSREEVFVAEFKFSLAYNSVASILYRSVTTCCALSPDNLYLASCDENGTLTVRSVDNGKVLQTVELKHAPKACWWAELYLWVVCEGMIAKYPYNSTQTKVVDSFAEESAMNFESVLKFAEGVLVIRLSDSGEISIFKIRNQEIYLQHIPDSNFAASSVTISSDGFAVLLYRKSCSDYQLWEIACEDRWELSSTGKLHDYDLVYWFCLTGAKNSRSSIWLTSMFTSWEDWNEPLCVSSINFPCCKRGFYHKLFLKQFGNTIIYADSNILILHHYGWIYFFNLADGEILTSLYVGLFPGFQNVSSFYIPSRGILVLAGKLHLVFFKIHNIEGNLPSIGAIHNT